MDETGLWLTPLALLPGVALLVMSTSARFGQLHAEIHHQIERGADGHAPRHLVERAILMRNALVSLYVAIAMLALASLAGGVMALWMANAAVPVLVLTSASVGCVALAAYLLIREARLLLEVIRMHEREIGREP